MRKRQKLSRSSCEDEAEAQSLRAQWLAGASIGADARPAAVGKDVIVAWAARRTHTATKLWASKQLPVMQ